MTADLPVTDTAIIGSGFIGRAWAISFARAGARVRLWDQAADQRDRFVPLPENTLQVLRRFWATHRNPALLFPNRQGGLKKSHLATTPLDREIGRAHV